MAAGKLKWDQQGEKLFETGVSDVILFPMTGNTYGNGVAWNGVTAVNEKPEGAEATDLYADNRKYLSLFSVENLKATIEAYMFPKEFEACDGQAQLAKGVNIGQQTRQSFGLIYKTLVGNDTSDTDYGYKWHIIYGCKASPSENSHSTVNDSPEANTFSWEITTTPVEIAGKKPTASVVIDSKECVATKLADFEKYILGTDADGDTAATASQMPLPAKLIEIFGGSEG